MGSFGRILGVALAVGTAASALAAQGSDPQHLYAEARARETVIRREWDAHPSAADATALLRRVRTLTGTYQDLAKLFPSSDVGDDALWQGGTLSADAFWHFGDATDRGSALRLLDSLGVAFPSSQYVRQAQIHIARLNQTPVAALPAATPGSTRPPEKKTNAAAPFRPSASATRARLTAIRRDVLPDALRITIELEQEVPFHADQLDSPPRVFIDLDDTQATDALKNAVLPYPDGVVHQVRLGHQTRARTRVVLDLQTATRYSVYALYAPYRVVIDFERPPTSGTAAAGLPRAMPASPGPPVTAPAPARVMASLERAPSPVAPLGPPTVSRPVVASSPGPAAVLTVAPAMTLSVAPEGLRSPAPVPLEPVLAPEPAAPASPSTNTRGGYSLSRQLGLGIAKIVIDPGHGGHDPGAKVRGLTEADMVLDVALKLEQLLIAQPGVEVVLTRRTNTYVSLEERTDIANRAEADLFLSIHANASANALTSGVETYFLNFAPNAAAEAVAARENAGGSKTMRHLPTIVRALALNDKIDESRDFATMVQGALYGQVRRNNGAVKNLGVKQAPFMVLIGATMPSVLTEIAFITNTQEARLLKTEKYRQQLAEALFGGIRRYQQSLKKAPVVATR